MQTAGAFEVPLIGTGTEPSVRPITQISALPGEAVTNSVAFSNPFGERATALVSLDVEAQNSALSLGPSVAKQLQLEARGSIEVPVCFTPTDSSPAQGTLYIDVRCAAAGDTPVRFAYPLLGLVERDMVGAPLAFAAKARQELREIVHLELDGYEHSEGASKLEAAVVPADGTTAAQQGLSVRPVRAHRRRTPAVLAFA